MSAVLITYDLGYDYVGVKEYIEKHTNKMIGQSCYVIQTDKLAVEVLEDLKPLSPKEAKIMVVDLPTTVATTDNLDKERGWIQDLAARSSDPIGSAL